MKIEDVRRSLAMWANGSWRGDIRWFDRALLAMLFVSDLRYPDVERAISYSPPSMQPWGKWVVDRVYAEKGHTPEVMNQLACILLGTRWEELTAGAAAWVPLNMIDPKTVDVDFMAIGVDVEELFEEFEKLERPEVIRWAMAADFDSAVPPMPLIPTVDVPGLDIERLGAALEAIRDSEA